MKRIVLTGGGSGGHIFPLVAVAENLLNLGRNQLEIIYIGPKHYLNSEFDKLGIKIYHISSGKLRRYFDLANFFDIFKIFFGFLKALFLLYKIMPDIVFSKGGPGALPVILAARFYFIPVFIHESDAIPGLTNKISAYFSERIAVSFKNAFYFFPERKTALVGNPVRKIFLLPFLDSKEAKNLLDFKDDKPLILVLGGSQGAQKINNFIINYLEKLTPLAQIFHQVGLNNLKEIEDILKTFKSEILQDYRCKGFLDEEDLKLALAAADLVISRAGSGAIFEIALAAKPVLLIPLSSAANNHQYFNAYEYAQSGAAVVIEEANLKINIVLNQIQNILNNPQKQKEMVLAAKSFARPQAAEIITKEILKIIKVDI